MSDPLNVFRRYTEDQQTWPESIAHLKGKLLRRKKDGVTYRIERPDGNTLGVDPAAYLVPVGDWWPIVCRSHWKTHKAILKQFELSAS